MPELPEVETVLRGLARAIRNRVIAEVTCASPHLRKLNNRGFQNHLNGRRIVRLERVGKNIFLHLDDDSLIWIHLRMTGQLLIRKSPQTSEPHIHLNISFRNWSGKMAFRDVRKFGQFIHVPSRSKTAFLKGLNLGVDALKVSPDCFVALLSSKRRMIKPLLLDQSVIAGLGNIYVDELLYACRVHPQTLAASLSRRKLMEMYRQMRRLLNLAVKKMGTTVDTFSGVDSEPGGFQKYLKAYGRAGELCPRCKKREITRMTVSQRGTYLCPNCQKRG